MLLTGVIPKGVYSVLVELVGGPKGDGSLSDIPEDAASIHLPPALVLHRSHAVWCGVVWCGVVWCGVVMIHTVAAL